MTKRFLQTLSRQDVACGLAGVTVAPSFDIARRKSCDDIVVERSQQWRTG
jgi:hypothetical protein